MTHTEPPSALVLACVARGWLRVAAADHATIPPTATAGRTGGWQGGKAGAARSNRSQAFSPKCSGSPLSATQEHFRCSSGARQLG
jgi:hypothetical protein